MTNEKAQAIGLLLGTIKGDYTEGDSWVLECLDALAELIHPPMRYEGRLYWQCSTCQYVVDAELIPTLHAPVCPSSHSGDTRMRELVRRVRVS